MPAKKNPTGGAKAGAKPRSKSKMKFARVVAQLKDRRQTAFRRKMKDLLCDANQGDGEAIAELEGIFEFGPGELALLCIPEERQAKVRKCTDSALILSGVLAATE